MRRAKSPRLVPEKHKQPGLCYVFTEDGLELPVIDVGHPAFSLSPPESELAQLLELTVRDIERRSRMPPRARRLMLKLLLRGSLLARVVGRARGSYAAGMGTYLLKLGPEMLPLGYTKKIDCAIAASLPCLSARLRLRDTVRLLADSLRAPLARTNGGVIRLFNIAGGPASDSLNALMLLRRENPAVLEGRTIEIVVLDADTEGPGFGERSLAALLEKEAPLAGLRLAMRSLPYDWRDTEALAAELAKIDPSADVVAISSEGGLFEYGTDAEIEANLNAFASAAPENAVFVGSISTAEDEAGSINRASGAAIRLRSLEEFREIAARGCWSVEETVSNPLGRCLALRLKR